MSLADLKGFAALLDGCPYDVHVGQVPAVDEPEMPRRYVLILGGFMPDVQERLTGSFAPRVVTPIVHAYGRTFDEAQWLADDVDRVLRPGGWGLRPVVEGRSCDPVMRDAALAAEPDRSGHPVWFHAISEYRFVSRPA